MDRVSSSSSVYRFAEPNFGEIPEEVFQKIVSFVDKADNKTLVSLASSSKDCWRLCGVDSLCSYFYAAKAAATHASIEEQGAILAVLIEWLPKVSSQLPVETRNKMLLELIAMTDSAELKLGDKITISSDILQVVKRLHIEELAILSVSECSPNEREWACLYELSKVVQQAVICYSNAIDNLSEQIQSSQLDMMRSLKN
jgi:hypothetical protein